MYGFVREIKKIFPPAYNLLLFFRINRKQINYVDERFHFPDLPKDLCLLRK